jgi:hypothetical protein
MIELLRRFKPSFPAVAVLLEPPTLVALRVADKRGDNTPLVQHEEPMALSSEQYLPPREEFERLAESVLARLGNPRRLSVVLGDPFFRSQILTLTDFPRKDDERQQVILWHLRKTLNLPIDGVRLRYEVLQKTPGSVVLWLTLCPEESVKALEEAFAAKGCEIGHVGASSVELFNLALAKDVMPRDGSCLLINRTPSYLSFLFCENGRPVFFRSKETMDGDEAGGSARIAQELRLTLAYHREKLGRGKLQKIIVRRYPQGVVLPLEEVVDEETRVEELSDVLQPLPNDRRREPEWLPLFGLWEGS